MGMADSHVIRCCRCECKRIIPEEDYKKIHIVGLSPEKAEELIKFWLKDRSNGSRLRLLSLECPNCHICV